MTDMVLRFLNAVTCTRPLCYSDYNEVVGLLESVKLEFYRRMVANYEDSKIIVNGDVYLFNEEGLT